MVNIKTLNKKQRQAVEHGTGPLLIIAGAGTGKTTVVTERIKHLITTRGVSPSEILALTFTEKAAKEMEERVDIALPYGYSQMWISTFHSFGERMLRSEAVSIGLDPKYRLMTEAESIHFVRRHLFDFDLSYFRPLGNPTKFINGLLGHFSRLQDEDIGPEEYIKWAKKKSEEGGSREEKLEGEKWEELALAYKKYEELKAKSGVMDFADLVWNTLNLFRKRPNLLKQYQEKFKYILVDEFQDTNITQNELVRKLAGEQSNLTVVADDDQAIYKWRGAAVSNVIQFRKNYPKTKIITLTENYRSTQNILDAAYHLIQNNNPDRLEVQEKINKKLLSSRKTQGVIPEFIHADRAENEAEGVAEEIISLTREEKRSYSDFAILVRANNHSEPFIRALSRNGIPYQFLGPGQLFRQPEIKEIFSYLKVLYNFEDSGAFYKVLTMEHLSLPARDIASLLNHAKKFNLSLFESAEKAGGVGLSQESKEKIKALVSMIKKHLELVPRESAGQILYYFLEESGLLKHMVNPGTPKDEKVAQNIARFFDKIKAYEANQEDSSVFAVVDWIDLSLDLGESPLAEGTDWTKENAVNILTIHGSKGLEFPVVFLVNMVDQRFPTRERREVIPIPDALVKEVLPVGDYHLQEERRLAYVGITRAVDRLFLTAADYYGDGKREKKMSPFIAEALGKEVLKKEEVIKGEQLTLLSYAPTSPRLSKPDTAEMPSAVPITYLSYSQIDCFTFCPLHYKLSYLLKIPTPVSPAQSFGISMHNTLRDFYQLDSSKNSPPEKELLDVYERSWIKLGYSSRFHEEKAKEQGRRYLKRYLKSELHDPKNPPLALEYPFSFPLAADLKVEGKIDRIDKTENGIEIIDYKTTDLGTKDLPTKNELRKNLQLSIYALAASTVKDPIFVEDPEKITLSLYFFNKGVKVSTTRTRKDLEEAKEQIIKIRKEMENSDFNCSGNFWCKDCEFKLFCEIH